MREEKFKAWDKVDKIMYSPRDVRCIEYMSGNKYKVTVNSNSSVLNDRWLHWDERVILLQFTGLRDKNGKEIYFDCSIITDGMHTTTVKWDSWSLLDDIQNGVDHWEVIGNIYENPELINK